MLDGNDFPNPYTKEREKNRRSGIALKEGDNNLHSGDDNNGKQPLARLLIVDDDPDITQVLKLGLETNGFLVDAFTNSEEALQSFKSKAGSYDLVLSDIRMPAVSGIQLSKKVKAIDSNVKVVLMTAFEIRDNEFSKLFPSASVDGFVQKPVGIRDLTGKILSIVDKRRRR